MLKSDLPKFDSSILLTLGFQNLILFNSFIQIGYVLSNFVDLHLSIFLEELQFFVEKIDQLLREPLHIIEVIDICGKLDLLSMRSTDGVNCQKQCIFQVLKVSCIFFSHIVHRYFPLDMCLFELRNLQFQILYLLAHSMLNASLFSIRLHSLL